MHATPEWPVDWAVHPDWVLAGFIWLGLIALIVLVWSRLDFGDDDER